MSATRASNLLTRNCTAPTDAFSTCARLCSAWVGDSKVIQVLSRKYHTTRSKRHIRPFYNLPHAWTDCVRKESSFSAHGTPQRSSRTRPSRSADGSKMVEISNVKFARKGSRHRYSANTSYFAVLQLDKVWSSSCAQSVGGFGSRQNAQQHFYGVGRPVLLQLYMG